MQLADLLKNALRQYDCASVTLLTL